MMHRSNAHATLLSLLTVTNIVVTILALIGFAGLIGHVWSSMELPSQSDPSRVEASTRPVSGPTPE